MFLLWNTVIEYRCSIDDPPLENKIWEYGCEAKKDYPYKTDAWINWDGDKTFTIYYQYGEHNKSEGCCYPTECYLAKDNPTDCSCMYMVECRIDVQELETR